MCVKEFLGYNCGHCSTPYLRQCPITSSNPTFPACKFPAERPIFTNENCHPCARVLWNIKVLAEEEAHHERHRRGDCDCSTIFDSEERERRLRPRSGKGKGKEKEVVHVGENMGPDTREGGDNEKGEDLHTAGHEGGGNFGYDVRHTSEGRAHNHDYTHAGAGLGPDEQGWGELSQMGATYEEYVGFYVAKKSNRVDLEHVEQGQGFPQGGFVPQEALWSGQLAMNQPGSGMKWYPEQNDRHLILPLLTTPPHLPALTAPQAELSVFDYVPKVWQSKAYSEPNGRFAHHFSPHMPTINIDATETAGDVGGTHGSPVVVSSAVVNTTAK